MVLKSKLFLIFNKIKFMKKLGDFIKEFRIQENLSQAELASILKVAQTLVSKWERNVCEPAFEMQQKIFALFDADLDYIYGLETDSQRNAILATLNIDAKLKDKLSYFQKSQLSKTK